VEVPLKHLRSPFTQRIAKALFNSSVEAVQHQIPRLAPLTSELSLNLVVLTGFSFGPESATASANLNGPKSLLAAHNPGDDFS